MTFAYKSEAGEGQIEDQLTERPLSEPSFVLGVVFILLVKFALGGFSSLGPRVRYA